MYARKIRLTDRYIKIKKPQIELTPEEIAERAAEVKAKHLAYKKENAGPSLDQATDPAINFVGKRGVLIRSKRK